MLISGTVILSVMGGVLIALIMAAIALAIADKHNDAQRRHWAPAESSTHW